MGGKWRNVSIYTSVLSTELKASIFCSGTSGLLLNEMFLSVFRGWILEVSVAAEGELVNVFRMSRLDFLVSICLFPAADESGHQCQSSHDDKNHNGDHPLNTENHYFIISPL